MYFVSFKMKKKCKIRINIEYWGTNSLHVNFIKNSRRYYLVRKNTNILDDYLNQKLYNYILIYKIIPMFIILRIYFKNMM